MRAWFVEFLLGMKVQLRYRETLFWSLFLPVLSFFLLAIAFGRGGVTTVRLGVIANDTGSPVQELLAAMQRVPFLRLQEGEESSLQQELSAGRLDGLLIIPADFAQQLESRQASIKLLLSGDVQRREILRATILRVVWEYTIRQERPLISLNEVIQEGPPPTPYVQFVLAGILAVSILSITLYAGSLTLVTARDGGRLKLLALTPISQFSFFGALVAQLYILALIMGLILAGLGIVLLGVQIRGNPFDLWLIFTVAALSFSLIGFAIASVARDHQGARGLANALFLAMLFMGDVFYRSPDFLQVIVWLLPVKLFTDAFRQVANLGNSLSTITPHLVGLGAWAALALFITKRYFRWWREA